MMPQTAQVARIPVANEVNGLNGEALRLFAQQKENLRQQGDKEAVVVQRVLVGGVRVTPAVEVHGKNLGKAEAARWLAARGIQGKARASRAGGAGRSMAGAAP